MRYIIIEKRESVKNDEILYFADDILGLESKESEFFFISNDRSRIKVSKETFEKYNIGDFIDIEIKEAC